VDEWTAFAATFAGSKRKANRDLHRFLQNDILPDVLPQLEARERARRQKELVMPRKRSSRIQSKVRADGSPSPRQGDVCD
jgi:hypothetical protein